MTKNDVTTFLANVRLKSESGRSMRNETKIPTKEDIKYFRPSRETMNKAIQELQKLGFTVPEADFCEKCKHPLKTITIEGKAELFEKVFNVKPIPKKDAKTAQSSKDHGVRTIGKLIIPDNLKDLIVHMYFEDPSVFLKE